MMLLEEAVFDFLIHDVALQNKICGRLYPIIIPQKSVLPAVSYQLVSLERKPALQKDTGFVRQVLQFLCHAKGYKEAVLTSRLILDALRDYCGIMGDLFIQAVLVVSEGVTYEPETEIYSAFIEFEFQYNEE